MKSRILRVVSLVLLTTGLSSAAFAAVQIKEMNAYSGKNFLPELALNPISYSKSKASIKPGNLLGILTIAALNTSLPIYEGTDEKTLKKGVGHFIGSVLPGQADNSVLAGHRDSVFSRLGELKLGDYLEIQTKTGKFRYKISKFRIVRADDRTVIVSTPDSELTLSTCYPFRFIGSAPSRYIVIAKLETNT